jgi:hypothetical protein
VAIDKSTTAAMALKRQIVSILEKKLVITNMDSRPLDELIELEVENLLS